jgi:hypothetical protein
MSSVSSVSLGEACEVLSEMLLSLPAERRASAFEHALSFRPSVNLETAFTVAPLRAAFANYWESCFGNAVPIERLREMLTPPVPILTSLEFSRLILARNRTEIASAIVKILAHLNKVAR